MHHIKYFSPLLVVIGLCAGLAAWSGVACAAQEPAISPRVDIPIGSTTQLQMSDKQFIRSARSENASIATVAIKIDDPRTVLVRGEKAGFTRIILTGSDNRTEMFDVYVGKTGAQLRNEFLSLVRRAVPTAIVDVIPSGATVIITGTVGSASSIQVIMEIARGLFPGANIINSMRVGGVQEVALEVMVAAVNRTKTRDLGFTWVEAGQHHFLTSALNIGNAPGITFPGALGAASLFQNFIQGGGNLISQPSNVFGIINDKQGFVGFLNALKQESLVKIMANPTVITLSGRPAFITDGGQVPVLTSSISGSSVNYKNFGTVVQMLPVVLGRGKIHLEVHAEISDVNTALALSVAGTNPASAPGFNSRIVQDAVQMEDGQTYAIGGLIQNRVTANAVKVPILGELPFIGAAFRTVHHVDDEEELLILITPRLVDAMSCDQLPKLLPGQETRNPDDFELFLEGILEAPRGQRAVSLRGYVPAYRNSPSADVYPCDNCGFGPAGQTGRPAVKPGMGPSLAPPPASTPANDAVTAPAKMPDMPASTPLTPPPGTTPGATPGTAPGTTPGTPATLPDSATGPRLAAPLTARQPEPPAFPQSVDSPAMEPIEVPIAPVVDLDGSR